MRHKHLQYREVDLMYGVVAKVFQSYRMETQTVQRIRLSLRSPSLTTVGKPQSQIVALQDQVVERYFRIFKSIDVEASWYRTKQKALQRQERQTPLPPFS